MIRVDGVCLAVAPLDIRAGTESARMASHAGVPLTLASACRRLFAPVVWTAAVQREEPVAAILQVAFRARPEFSASACP